MPISNRQLLVKNQLHRLQLELRAVRSTRSLQLRLRLPFRHLAWSLRDLTLLFERPRFLGTLIIRLVVAEVKRDVFLDYAVH